MEYKQIPYLKASSLFVTQIYVPAPNGLKGIMSSPAGFCFVLIGETMQPLP